MGNRLHRSQSSQACPTAESVCSAAGSEVAATWRDKNVSPLPQYHQCRAKHCYRDYLDRLLDDVRRLLSANYVKVGGASRYLHCWRAPAIAEHIPTALQDALNRIFKPDRR